jgi:hypothetical protein
MVVAKPCHCPTVQGCKFDLVGGDDKASLVVHGCGFAWCGQRQSSLSYLLALVAVMYIDHDAMTFGRITYCRSECLPTAVRIV